ncbi:HlyD family secretion protein [Acuticoccus mangrovi]|uniref:HlyD family efflux transporter periplasmic adaptor subunit n=1 Tax=Acuticoccus mangrovi TaxID=2796142 RepID=A0A934IPE4_9HYPH|nr:HlyD family efflux transporter periplasmic adaptor subunit [Acuticoccus mangrovi]MBJ3776138.1 HlyD family efflux transporter periplasmic adaptor subunit [Acuticoccus mangrovi]
MTSLRKFILPLGVVALVGVAAYAMWLEVRPSALPEGFAASNGRIEAVEIDIAAKSSGRVKEILVDEGDFVEAGAVLVRMDTAVLEAQLREAQANLEQAKIGVKTAGDEVTQAEAEKRAAEAVVKQRQAELEIAQKTFERADHLVTRNAIAVSELDEARAAHQGAEAAVAAAEASLAAADAAIGLAKSGVVLAKAKINAVEATIESIQADLDDAVLKSPRPGRIQYLVARPGEVVSGGATILNLVDVGDVYMTFFLPTADAGRIAVGTEARIVLDAAPQYVIPASVSFVASVAQFTPKTVETREEREKLMFRVKARIDPAVLKEYVRYVKTGLPGTATVRVDPRVAWPEELQPRLP